MSRAAERQTRAERLNVALERIRTWHTIGWEPTDEDLDDLTQEWCVTRTELRTGTPSRRLEGIERRRETKRELVQVAHIGAGEGKAC